MFVVGGFTSSVVGVTTIVEGVFASSVVGASVITVVGAIVTTVVGIKMQFPLLS